MGAGTVSHRRRARRRRRAPTRAVVRAAHVEVGRRAATVADARSDDLDDLAMPAADDALVAILRKLHTYRGYGRFTTWAYKFALLEAAAKMRRRRWIGRKLPLEADAWASCLSGPGACPAGRAEASELIYAVRDASRRSRPRSTRPPRRAHAQRRPDRCTRGATRHTRGALYKTLHDGRRKLRARLRKGRPDYPMPDFTLTGEQRNIRELAHDFAEKEIRPVAWDTTAMRPGRGDHRQGLELGLMSPQLPERYGGTGASYFDGVLIGEELAWAAPRSLPRSESMS